MINKEFSPHHSIEMAELLCWPTLCSHYWVSGFKNTHNRQRTGNDVTFSSNSFKIKKIISQQPIFPVLNSSLTQIASNIVMINLDCQPDWVKKHLRD
jgi:hypothetical protein